ncbi:MAG: bestrophin family ion channel [Rhodopila sp.]|nr:bestrophin family ion channel [Rhodopila sp.]
MTTRPTARCGRSASAARLPDGGKTCYAPAMIVRPHPTPLGLLFILRGSILPAIASRLLVVLIVSSAVVWLHRIAPAYLRDVTPAPFTLLGLALSIFLGFRNNVCYERWWEGRKQWGQLLAETRVLVREIMTLLPDDLALRRRCAHRVVAFAHVLRDQLRDAPDQAARVWLPATEWDRVACSRSRPDAILLAQAEELGALLRQGALSDMLYRVFSERLLALTAIQTACERLRSSPTPFAYSLLVHRTAWLFCLLLPFGTVGTLGLATPVLTLVLAYAFFGLDALGEELEEPFTQSQNALPLDAMVRAIEIATGEALGEATLPEPLLPLAFVLL